MIQEKNSNDSDVIYSFAMIKVILYLQFYQTSLKGLRPPDLVMKENPSSFWLNIYIPYSIMNKGKLPIGSY